MSDIVEIAGRTALITGSAKRLGRAVARALAKSGVNLVLHYRTADDAMETLAKELSAFGVRIWTHKADFGEAAAVEGLFDRAQDSAGPIDFLINNASIFPLQTISDFSREDLYQCMDINAYAPLVLCRRMAAQQREGAVINFLDTMITDYDRKHVPYHLSKQALFSLMRMMAVDFAPALRVNAVAPGLVLPPEGESVAYLERLRHSNPLQRYGTEDGVTEAVLFLLRSGFITGQVIFVDGGRHLRGKMYD